MSDPNSGEGWYEWIRDGAATTHCAYVHEGGAVYDPEYGWNPADFLLAAATGRAFRLVRADVIRGAIEALDDNRNYGDGGVFYAAASIRDDLKAALDG